MDNIKEVMYISNPKSRVRCDTRSIFKWSSTGLKSVFPGCWYYVKYKEPHPRFELSLPFLFFTIITIRPQVQRVSEDLCGRKTNDW